MDIAALNTPATPPYDFQHYSAEPVEPNITQNMNKVHSSDLYFDRPESSEDHATTVTQSTTTVLLNETGTPSTVFPRVSPMSIPSPPELLANNTLDNGDVNTSSLSSVSSLSLSDDDTIHKNRKSTPYRSPANIITDPESVVFQLERNFSPKILSGRTTPTTMKDHGLLWSLRQRVMSSNQTNHCNMLKQKRNIKRRLSAPCSERRVMKPTKINMPKPQWLKNIILEDEEDEEVQNENEEEEEEEEMEEKLAAQPMPPHDHPSSLLSTQYQQLHNKHPLNNNNPTYTLPNYAPSNSNAFSWHPDANNGANISVIPEVNPFYHPRLHSHSHPMTTTTATSATPAPESSASAPPRRKSSNHGSSGRPTRVKGPCQACHETSDGCMRKAFHWPFAVSTTYNDKGKPFVYLCNKCGLRYNKSGGCVCRHCRWVLCKEEKRKAMEFIELMRRSRPDGRVDPEEDIENFVCAPKYWSCGHPWKVSWVLNTEHDEEDEDEDMPSRSHTNSTSSIHIPPIAAAIAPAFYVSSA